jgi:hypothetical protein
MRLLAYILMGASILTVALMLAGADSMFEVYTDGIGIAYE